MVTLGFAQDTNSSLLIQSVTDCPSTLPPQHTDFLALYTLSPDFEGTVKQNTRQALPQITLQGYLQRNNLKHRGTNRAEIVMKCHRSTCRT